MPSNFAPYLPNKIVAAAVVAANSAITLPANAFLLGITIKNSTANAVTGGIKVGTTAGATDIVAALTVGANALVHVLDAALLKRIFSTSATQQLFFDAVAAWNSASVDITVLYIQL